MNKFLGIIFLIFGNLLSINAGYTCTSADNCQVYCNNVETFKLNLLKNTDWIPVPLDTGDCYFHNKLTKIDSDSYPISQTM